MSRREEYAMSEGTELGLLAHYCRIAERKGHDWAVVFAAIPQVKPARIMSLVEIVTDRRGRDRMSTMTEREHPPTAPVPQWADPGYRMRKGIDVG
jgi:hypothetical protein